MPLVNKTGPGNWEGKRMIVSIHRFFMAAALTLLLAIGSTAKSRAEVTLEMAYMPIVPCSQLFV